MKNKKATIVLPDHADMVGTRICHVCEGMMLPCTTTHTFCLSDGKVEVTNIKAYKCAACGEIVYSSTEAKMIDDVLLSFAQKKMSKRCTERKKGKNNV